MRQFPVKTHHHAPGYTAAGCQNTAISDNTVYIAKRYICIPLVHRKSLRMSKTGSSPGFGSSLHRAFSGFAPMDECGLAPRYSCGTAQVLHLLLY